MNRKAEAPAHEQFLNRWSPRAFSNQAVSAEQLASMFEAARWAPSCFNAQPWIFVYGNQGEDHQRILDLLMEGNQSWAKKAPVLGIVFAERNFARNQKPNRWGAFDSGAACMSLSLQANHLGLVTHFMSGFHADKTYQALQVPEEQYEAMAAFAIGYAGQTDDLPAELREREVPSDRKPLVQVAYAGRFKA